MVNYVSNHATQDGDKLEATSTLELDVVYSLTLHLQPSGFFFAISGRSAGVARTFGVGEAGGSIPLAPTI